MIARFSDTLNVQVLAHLKELNMRRSPMVLMLTFLALAFQGCHTAGTHQLADHDRAQLKALTVRWETAANSHDWNALGATYTPDAVLLPPNGPAIVGRDNIKNFFAGFPPFSDMSLKLLEIDGDGDVAYVRGAYTMTIHIPNANAIHEVGKYLEIRRKQSDGSWLISRDMYSSDIPAAP